MLQYEVVKQMPIIDPSTPNTTIVLSSANAGLIGSTKNSIVLNASPAEAVYSRGVYQDVSASAFALGPQQEMAIGIDLSPLEKSDLNIMLDLSGTMAVTTLDEGSADDLTILPYIGINHNESGAITSINYHLLSGGVKGDDNVSTYCSQVLLGDITTGGISLEEGVQFGFLIRNNKPIASSSSNTDIATIVTSMFGRYCLDGYKIQGML
jgi:hypothetical protein